MMLLRYAVDTKSFVILANVPLLFLLLPIMELNVYFVAKNYLRFVQQVRMVNISSYMDLPGPIAISGTADNPLRTEDAVLGFRE